MNPALGLAVGRLGIGATALLTPRLFARMTGLQPESNASVSYPTRLFGSREILMGAATLLTTGEVRRNLVGAGVAVDAADVLAALGSAVRGDVSKKSGAMLALPAGAAVAAGYAGLQNL